MGYRSAFDKTGQSSEMGSKAEDIFEILANNKKLKIERATLKQQLSNIDFIITNKDKKTFVDVKACKKTSRSSSESNDEFVWIEFKNINGNNGWLYGASDFIAFERKHDFIIVPKKPLIVLCERIINKSIRVDKTSDALYSIYSRKGRKDEISLIKMQDILNNIKVTIWNKE
jgi:Holliday junction resolvase-like predicted endonuclease